MTGLNVPRGDDAEMTVLTATIIRGGDRRAPVNAPWTKTACCGPDTQQSMRRLNSQILTVERYLVARHRQKNGSSLNKALLGVSRLLTARSVLGPARVDQGTLYIGQLLGYVDGTQTHSLATIGSCHNGIVLPLTREDFFRTVS